MCLCSLIPASAVLQASGEAFDFKFAFEKRSKNCEETAMYDREPMGEPVTTIEPLHNTPAVVDSRVVKRKADGQVAIRWYKQKFRESWLLDERFKSWLVSVPHDPYRAKCKLCNADLRAGKSELEKHAKTKHHRDTVKAVEDVKALLGFANQAEALQPEHHAPPIEPAGDMSVEQSDVSFHVHDEELSVEGPPSKRPHLSSPQERLAVPYRARWPRVQNYAPDFRGTAVVDNQFREIQLSDYRGKFLLLFFYPQDFTLACPGELIEYSERIAEFRSLNVELVAVSTDSYYTHLAWINTPRKLGGLGKINVPLLSDFSKKISRDYDVLLENTGIALRASFIIDPKGMVRQITVNDVNLYRSVDETLRLLKALQYVEKQSEVTRATWEPEAGRHDK